MEIFSLNLSVPRYISYPFQMKWERIALAVGALFFVYIAYLTCFSNPRKTSDDNTPSIEPTINQGQNEQQPSSPIENSTSTEVTKKLAPLTESTTFVPFTIQVRKNAQDEPISITVDSPTLTVWEFIQKAYQTLYPGKHPLFCFNTKLFLDGTIVSTAYNIDEPVRTILENKNSEIFFLIEDRMKTTLSDANKYLQALEGKYPNFYGKFDENTTDADKLEIFQTHVNSLCDRVLNGEQKEEDLSTLCGLRDTLSTIIKNCRKNSQNLILNKYFNILQEKINKAIDSY